ncbi:hypothetical protein ACLESD_12535 [Pyxidicoccus sp. 3LFB2]
MRAKPRLKLYWVWTEDHDEDWFIVARSAREARREHEEEEGYAPGDAACRLVCPLPDDMQDVDEGWPDHEILRRLGAEFLRTETPRAVRLKDVLYTEGMLEAEIRRVDDDVSERLGAGRPNRTKREPPN